MPDQDNDPDVVVIPPKSLAAIIILAAVVGGVAGYLVCNFFEGKPPQEDAREVGQLIESSSFKMDLYRSDTG